MKNISAPAQDEPEEELQSEYRLDYATAKPNRFSGVLDAPRVVVVLDPEVAEVFETSAAVNDLLRALIKTMPSRNLVKSKRKRRAA